MVNVGQMRKHFFYKYLGDTGYTASVQPQEKLDSNNNRYIDTVISCGTLDSAKTYYTKFKLEKLSGDPLQKINIRLRYSEDILGMGEDVYQNLKTVVLNTNSSGQTIELMFTPNANYNLISFELVRTVDDSNQNPDGSYGRIVQIPQSSVKFREVINLIPSLSKIYDGLKTLKQIGVRSEPGLRMCINGEEIFVGPSGVYEIYNGMQIRYLGFVIDDDDSTITSDNKKSDFIVDFTY